MYQKVICFKRFENTKDKLKYLMKIQKIGFALGSQKKTIKSLVSRNYERIIKTTGISKFFMSLIKKIL